MTKISATEYQRTIDNMHRAESLDRENILLSALSEIRLMMRCAMSDSQRRESHEAIDVKQFRMLKELEASSAYNRRIFTESVEIIED